MYLFIVDALVNITLMNIILFFTYGVSLKNWKSSGLFDREIKLYKHLSKHHDLNITFVTYGDEGDLIYSDEIPDIEIVPLYKYFKNFNNKILNLFYSLFIGFKLKTILKKEKSLIKTNQLWGSWVAIIFKIVTNNLLIVRTGYDLISFKKKENKSNFIIFFYYLLTQLSLIFSNFYLVSSKADQEFLMNSKLVHKKKIELMPNWVSVSQINYDSPRKDIVAVGRLEHQKNFEYLIKSFANSDKKINLVGDGTLKIKLEMMAKNLNCNVNFLGKMSNREVLGLIAKHKYYVLTSHYEGNPKSLLEAMSAGCIVIAPNNKNIAEIIKNGFNGFIYSSEIDDLNKLIDKLDSMDLFEVKKNAFEYVKRNNSLEKISEKEVEIYKKALG